MDKWQIVFAISMLLASQPPSLAKSATAPTTSSKPPVKAAPVALPNPIQNVVRQQSAVLAPDGQEAEFDSPAGALYTDSDDCC